MPLPCLEEIYKDICEDPYNLTLRSIYADYCEDLGDIYQADYIRTQIKNMDKAYIVSHLEGFQVLDLMDGSFLDLIGYIH